MKQTTLFPVFDEQQVTAKARRTDPQTSHVAAESYESTGGAESDRAAILEVIRRGPLKDARGFPMHGITSGEIAQQLGDGWSNVRCSRRLPEIEKQGHIVRGLARVCTAKQTEMLTWHLMD